MKELKNIKVVDRHNRRLSPTTATIAKTLIAREKAKWIIENDILMLLKTQKEIKELKKKVIEEENRICYICGYKIPEDIPATIDHVNPKSKLGKDDRVNLRCCCKRCNDDKANMNINEYFIHIQENIKNYDYIDLEMFQKCVMIENTKKE